MFVKLAGIKFSEYLGFCVGSNSYPDKCVLRIQITMHLYVLCVLSLCFYHVSCINTAKHVQSSEDSDDDEEEQEKIQRLHLRIHKDEYLRVNDSSIYIYTQQTNHN